MQLAQMNKAKNLLFSEFMENQHRSEKERLEMMLQNQNVKEAYARHYNMDVNSVGVDKDHQYMGHLTRIPDSMFLDFDKDPDQIGQGSIYYTMNQFSQDTNERKVYEDESLQ